MPLTTRSSETLRSRVSGLKALVADFDSTSLDILLSFLKEAGMDVIVARDGMMALELFRSQKPQIVFLEAMLPKISGFELSQQINLESQGKVPVIIITGIYRDNRHRIEAIQTYKAAAFLTKPWQREEMAQVIMSVLGPTIKPTKEEEDLALDSLEEITPLLKEIPPLKTVKSATPAGSTTQEKKAQEPLPESDEIDRLLEKTLADLGFESKKKPSIEGTKEAPVKTLSKEIKFTGVVPEFKPRSSEAKTAQLKPTESKVIESASKESRSGEKTDIDAPIKDLSGPFFVEKEKIIDTEKLPFAVSPLAEKKASEEKDQKISEPLKPSLNEDKIETEEAKGPLLLPTLYPTYLEVDRQVRKKPSSFLLFGITGAIVITLLGIFVFRPKKPAPFVSPQGGLQESIFSEMASEAHQNITTRLEEQERPDKISPLKVASRQKEALSGLLATLKKEETPPEEDNPPILVTETGTAPLALPPTPPPIKIENPTSPPATKEAAVIHDETKSTSQGEVTSITIKEGDLVPLDQVDIQPRPIKVVEPKYPEPAKQMGLEGVVVVNALISEKGEVIRTEILRGLKNGAALEQAAEAAIRQWKFSPAVKNGVKVKVWKPIETRFRLKQ